MLQRTALFTCVFHIISCRTPLRDSYLSNNSEIHHLFPVIALDFPDKSCTNSASCRSQRYRMAQKMSHSALPFFRQYDEQRTSLQGRSYYNGFGAPATANYYPTFDPISVLASLAFLAFLLQTFASLFDRSRSLIPTVVSSRQSSPEFKLAGITRRVLNALEEYDNLSGSLVQNKQHDSGSVETRLATDKNSS